MGLQIKKVTRVILAGESVGGKGRMRPAAL
jgi:hypothetical protein